MAVLGGKLGLIFSYLRLWEREHGCGVRRELGSGIGREHGCGVREHAWVSCGEGTWMWCEEGTWVWFILKLYLLHLLQFFLLDVPKLIITPFHSLHYRLILINHLQYILHSEALLCTYTILLLPEAILVMITYCKWANPLTFWAGGAHQATQAIAWVVFWAKK